ncbi:MAG: hypothetical protein R3290_01360 [Acidimicrobiia bacterium]|nr:hypothetical protein [Acidimicrobiia bacterium]
MGYDDKIRAHCADDLGPGETVQGVARVLVKGGTKKLAVMPLGPVAAALAGDADEEGLDQGRAVNLELATTMAVVLTDKRLIFYRRSALNRLKEQLGWVPRDRIASIEVVSEGFGKPTTITFRDGSVLELEGVKVDDVEALAFGD